MTPGSARASTGIRNVLGHCSKLHQRISERRLRHRSLKYVLLVFKVYCLGGDVCVSFSLLTFLQNGCDVVRGLSGSFSFLSAIILADLSGGTSLPFLSQAVSHINICFKTCTQV